MLMRLALCVCVLATAVHGQRRSDEFGKKQEPPPKAVEATGAETVPMLGDLPLLGELFQRRPGRTWYPLDGFAQDFAPDPDLTLQKSEREDENALPFRERWIVRELKTGFPKLTSVDVVLRSEERWSDRGHSRSARRGLELVGPDETITAATKWLDGVVSRMFELVTVEIQFISGLEIDTEGDPGPRVIRMTPERIAEVQRAAQRQKDCEIIAAPKLSVYNGQRANASIVNQTSYIKDFEVEVVKGAAIADPIIDVVQDGMVVDFSSMMHPDGKTISVDARVSIASLKRPIEEFETTLSGLGSSVTIQIPTLSLSRWKSEELVLEDGHGGFLVTGLAAPDSKWKDVKSMDILFTVRRVQLDDFGAPLGKIIAHDAEANRSIARFDRAPADAADLVNGKATIYRGGKKIGTVKVIEIQGKLIVLEPMGCAPKAGDRVN